MEREYESRRELALAQELDPHSKIKRSATILFGQIYARRFEEAIRASRDPNSENRRPT